MRRKFVFAAKQAVGWVIGGGQVALRALVLTAATTAISSFYRGHAARKKCCTLLKSGESLPGAHQDQPMMEGETDIIRNLPNDSSYRRN